MDEPINNRIPSKLLKSVWFLRLGKLSLLIASLYATFSFTEYFFMKVTLNKESKEKSQCAGFDSKKFADSRIYSLINSHYLPNDVVDHCGPEWRYSYQIDANGFRSNGENNEGRSSILSIGDSFTFGFGVKDSETFSSALNAYNAGLWGITYDIHLKALDRGIAIVKPKTVIWTLYPSHIITMMPSDWSTRCPGDNIYISGGSKISIFLRNFIKKHLISATEESYFIKYFVNKLNINEIKIEDYGIRVYKNCYSTKEILLYDRNLANNEYTDDKLINQSFLPDRDNVYKQIYSYLVEAKKLSIKHKIDIYFAIAPSRLSLAMIEKKYKSSFKSAEIDPRLPDRTLTDLIVQAGFTTNNVINLVDEFSRTKHWRDYYYVEDAHWNAKGHEFVANVLKNKLTF